jgi:hypothetical protein
MWRVKRAPEDADALHGRLQDPTLGTM